MHEINQLSISQHQELLKIARNLCSRLRIPGGDSLVYTISDGSETTNELAVAKWFLEQKTEMGDLPFERAVVDLQRHLDDLLETSR